MRCSVTLAVVALAGGTAHAGSSNAEVYLRADGPDVVATIIGGPRLARDHIRIVDSHGTSVAASALREAKDGPDTVAIAFVIAGSEIAMGNTDLIAPDDPTYYPGYLQAVERGIAGLDLAHATPAGSLAMLITYDATARTRLPLGPVAARGQTPLGTQRDYFGKLGNELVVATTLAVDELARARTARKLLVVIGDGNDTNNDAAAPQLALLKKRAAQEGIHTYGIIYKTPLSEEGNVITKMIPTTTTVNSYDGIAAMLATIGLSLADRYTVTFPGDALRWDGEPQDLTIWLGLDDTDPVTVTLGERSAPSPGLSWWGQLAIGVGLVGLLALLIRLRARSVLAS